MKRLLIVCAALALVACGSSTPEPAPIPGATLKVQLSENANGAAWGLGDASIDLRAFVDTGTGDVIASGSADASDRADRPATDAVLWLTKVLSCTNTVTSSDAAAKVLLTLGGDFSTDQGGGSLFAERASLTGLNLDMLSYATADTTLSGSLTCGKDTFPVQVELKAGWNIVEAQVGKDALTYAALPLTGSVQLTRDDN